MDGLVTLGGMLRRLFFGLLLGLLMGVFAAAAVVKGLHMETFANPVFAYLFAAVTGVLTGLVTGKPIWSRDGKIEAGLKAVFGAMLAAGGMFAIRKWLAVDVDLSALQAGQGAAAQLPAVALPAIGAALGGLFELDNDDSGAGGAKAPKTSGAGAKAAKGATKPGARVVARGERDARDEGSDADLDEADDEIAPPARASKKRR